MENGTPLSVLALFIIKCIFYIMFSPFLPRRRAKALAKALAQALVGQFLPETEGHQRQR